MTYAERVQRYESEGMTRRAAQGIVELEDLQQQHLPTMEYNTKAAAILDRMLQKEEVTR